MAGIDYRRRYVTDSVSTASPGQLLVMLYDRLVLDIERAEAATRAGDRATAHATAVHAQEIVLELRSSLDTAAWSGGPALSSLYGFLYAELVQANTRGEATRFAGCRTLVEPLRDAWREAAASQAAGQVTSSGATSA